MKLFPAIDILNGRAVRLLYGKKELVTDYGLPLDRAKLWRDAGADFLHVVDLCGAFEGESRIDGEIEKIAALGVKVQSGGGLRTMEEIERRLNAGASRVVLGTVCHTNPALFREAVEKYGDKIVAGIDCKDGFLSVKQVFTDVSRDGALSGVAVEETAKLGLETGLNVVASGGVSSIGDLEKLAQKGVYGAILGRSLYEGKIDLKEALERFQND